MQDFFYPILRNTLGCTLNSHISWDEMCSMKIRMKLTWFNVWGKSYSRALASRNYDAVRTKSPTWTTPLLRNVNSISISVPYFSFPEPSTRKSKRSWQCQIRSLPNLHRGQKKSKEQEGRSPNQKRSPTAAIRNPGLVHWRAMQSQPSTFTDHAIKRILSTRSLRTQVGDEIWAPTKDPPSDECSCYQCLFVTIGDGGLDFCLFRLPIGKSGFRKAKYESLWKTTVAPCSAG